jgi:hypothetical protein
MDVFATSTLDELREPRKVHDIIVQIGIEEMYVDTYGPSYLSFAKKNGIWQSPLQLSEYLCFISNKQISTYLEIGAWSGLCFNTVVNYLNKFNKISHCIAVDEYYCKEAYNNVTNLENAIYLNESSFSNKFQKIAKSIRWDLVMIDGDHCYKSIVNDYCIVQNNARLIAFHDICNIYCPDAILAWHRIKNEEADRFNIYEFTKQDPLSTSACMGIGVLELKSDLL